MRILPPSALFKHICFSKLIRLQRDIGESIDLFSDFFAWSNFYSFQVPDLKKKLSIQLILFWYEYLILQTIIPGDKYSVSIIKKSTVSHQYNGTSCDL